MEKGKDDRGNAGVSVVFSAIDPLRPYLTRYKGRLLLGILLLTSLFFLALPGPILNQRAIDDAILKQDLGLLIYFAILILLLQIGTRVVDFIANRIFILISQNAVYELKRDLFSRVLRLPVPYLMEKESGYLLSRINEVNQVGAFFSNSVAQILVSIFEFAGILAILLYMNWYLTLICLTPLPILFILSRRWSTGVMQRSRELMEAGAGLTGKLDESLSGILEVKALAGERREEEETSEKMTTYLKKSISQSIYLLTGREMMMSLGMIGGIIILLAGGYGIIVGQFTIGGFVAFNGYVGRLYAPAITLATTGLILQPSFAALRRVKELFDLTEEDKGDIELERIKGEIEFRDVHFSYEDKMVLNGISLKIKPGEKLAIIGPNGSGKTTMMKLLLGFFDPDGGKILIDGQELSRIRRSSLREKVGIVSQSIFLFNTTLENNITYCRPDATGEEVRKAMELSGASSFIDFLPLKEKTPIGSRGIKLSGGQIQMIGIARILLKNPDVLIFDEANAHLDESSKELIKRTIRNEKRTCIIVSHQRDFVDVVDRVFQMPTGIQ